MNHTEPTVDEIDRVARNLVIRKRVNESSGPHVVADCPVCGHQGKLYLNLSTGLWDCKHIKCDVGERGGNLFKLANVLGIRVREKRLVRSVSSVIKTSLRKQGVSATPVASIESVDAACARVMNAEDADGLAVHAYLATRGIQPAAIEHFKLGVAYVRGDSGKHRAVGIPYLAGSQCVLVKMRNVEPDCTHADRFRRTKGGDSALFNVDGVRGRRRVVFMEAELDAISVWQCGVTEVCASSIGAKKDVPEVWKEALADAEDIVLWFDDDEAGHAAVEALSAVFGTHRVRIAFIPDELIHEVEARTGKKPKDANDLVRAGVEAAQIRGIVDAAKPLEVGSVVHVSAYTDAIAAEIQKGAASLGMSTGIASLDALIRGYRPGEVTGITAHTGHGKSTFTTFLAEILAHRGEPVLTSAFEDGPVALAGKSFRRKFGRPISSLVTEEDRADAMAALPRLSEDPIYVIDSYGRVKWADVADAIRYAVRRLGVKWVLLDHLGFLAKVGNVELHEHLEKVAMDVAALAVELGIHIVVIIHPNGKIEETVIPTGDSLKGSSGLKQCLSNGLTVFRMKDPTGESKHGRIKVRDASGRRMEIDLDVNEVLVYVWKKRHPDAREGMTVLRFDARRTSYHERDNAAAQVDLPGTGETWRSDAFDDDAGAPDLFGGVA